MYLADCLAVEYRLQAEHSVGCRMLGTDIDNIVVIGEKRMLHSHQFSVFIKAVFERTFRFGVIRKHIRVVLRTHVVVLTERIALEIRAQVYAAHILVAKKLDAEKVVNLTLQYLGTFPQVAHRRYIRLVTVGIHCLNARALVSLRVLQYINAPESFLAEVFSDNGDKEVEMLIIPQFCHLGGKSVQFELSVF